MYYTEDEHFARQLQSELQAYENFKRQKESTTGKENLSPIDSRLEYIDPTPSIHDLFVKFDKKFFWNTLGMVQVLWSNKMTNCAGMCSFEGGRGLCKISLSAPLLSLRPRKDLVETLLHEMIHAYLFVTHNYKDREDHGPEFHKHMFRINKVAGTNITVYHTFHDEVEYYQKHIWRCNGPCQKKKPYFGFVKRAMNRPPGPNDNWWSQHQKECGGTFTKISEPEKKKKINRKTKVIRTSDKNKDIRDFFTDKKGLEKNSKNQGDYKPSNIKTFADLNNKAIFGVRNNTGSATVVITNTNKGKRSKTNYPKNNNSNKGLMIQQKIFQNVENSGSSRDLSARSDLDQSKDLKECSRKDSESDKVRETVRNIWASKFSSCKSPKKILPDEHASKKNLPDERSGKKNLPDKSSSKKSLPDEHSSRKNFPDERSPKKVKLECPLCNKGFSQEEIQSHVEVCLEKGGNPEKDKKTVKPETSSSEKRDEMKKCAVCNEDVPQSGMNDHIENCLNCSFENENDGGGLNNEIVCESVPCPCCYKWFQEDAMNAHIDECLTLNTLKEEILASRNCL